MLHEKTTRYHQLGDDGDMTNRGAWTGKKRSRKHPRPSSSDASAVTTQDHQDKISPATDMEGIIQSVQDHQHLARLDSGSQEEEEEEEEERYGSEVDISQDDAASYTNLLAPDIPPVYTRSKMTTEDAEELCLRLARYRVAYYKNVGPQQSAYELKNPEDYSVEELQENRYFYALEKDESFEGCFHPDDTFVAELDDYQRLLVFNGLPDNSDSLYIYWEDYHAYHRTYEVDKAYAKFYRELSSKIKWLKDYLDLDCESEKWIEVGTRAWRQALRIASDVLNLSVDVASMAFDEYISELREDKSLENWFLFYFDVWKINSLKKASLRAAVEEAYEKHTSSLLTEEMDAERKAQLISICVDTFRALPFVGDNSENLEENEARDLLRKTVFKKYKPKNMANYAQKKLEIAGMMKLHPRKA